MTKLRAYRIALAASLVLNALLIAALALYIHFEGLLSVIEDAVGILG